MAAFISTALALASSTATRVVEAEPFPRRIYLKITTGGEPRVAFTESDAPTGAVLSVLALNQSAVTTFVVPACEEIWLYGDSSATVQLLVTAEI